MKIKNSITNKLFIITSLAFAAFLGGTLIIQSLFFERFYVSEKKSDLKLEIEKFKGQYNKTANISDVADVISEYESANNIKIAILDSNNQLKSVNNLRQNTFKLRQLSDYIAQWSIINNVTNVSKASKTVIDETRSMGPEGRGIIAITPDKDKEEVIFALYSLQPVNEAVSVIKRFYVYFCIGAGFFILLLSLAYSNMIAKPLLKINKVATKMSKLDFTEICEVKSNDEIGNVASSLNFLSENLNQSLNSLREANAKLEEDIEKERNLEKMRKEFIAAVSHELKTPISLIDGYAVGLKDNIFEGEDEDYYLDIIIDEAKKMGSLVSDMLDLSQLESGVFKLRKEEFNVVELIKSTLKKYSNLISEKGVKVELNLLEEFNINADWNRLEQVLTNFITNALRHIDNNGIIYVNMVDNNSSVTIEIENTGSRIPEEEISKVWDKFYKIDKSRNRKVGGTGIGLSIVKNILTLHKFPFGVNNTDKGVKFYFNIPKND